MVESYYEDEGSSPLARGLLVHLIGLIAGGRIIPARAGFTPDAPTAPTSPTDHPRSRGVYEWIGTERLEAGGSSPLARGLPVTIRQTEIAGGIIPARAGFTEVG